MIGTKRYLQGALLIMLILLGVYILQTTEERKLKANSTPEITKEEVSEKPTIYSPEEDVSYTYGKSYADAKNELIAEGWRIFTPEDFISKGDKRYPEIGWCDVETAICSANFRKGDIVIRINVHIKSEDNYTEWIVKESE